MNRVLVFLLAAFDAVVTAGVGIAAALAPLTVLWVFGMSGAAPWDALWPSAAKIWQLGNLVPLDLTLPTDYLLATGISPDAASFTVSLAPLGFVAFTAISGARSGTRASQSGAAFTGVIAGGLVFAAIAAGVALTSATEIAAVSRVEAIVFPALVFALPALLGALVGEWREAERGPLARLRDLAESAPSGWSVVPEIIGRGVAISIVGLIGAGALLVAVAVFARGSEIVALYEASGADLLGAIMLTLAGLLYLPTLIVWAIAFLAGPGVALGEGSVVSAVGTQTGVLPGIPLLGVIPESTTPWLLLLALAPVGIGAFAGWVARSLFAGTVGATHEPVLPRLVAVGAIATLTAGAAALLSLVASGALGPGRLAQLGPEPGPVALAVGLEVAVGAGILLLSPRRAERSADTPTGVVDAREASATPLADAEPSVD
ncbi:hypothetical protein GCM10009808_01040 [Microbacterium sediminicola]|uniref:Integral membrane protein n=1 Tax=Microbacterium sediminicola TaxID=415210 RepID=A0ABN2HHJ9_9MICO